MDYSLSQDSPQERRAKFILEYENPFKCEKCGARFREKQKFKEHKSEFHSY